MDGVEYELERIKRKHQRQDYQNKKNPEKNKIAAFFTQVLLAVIFLLISVIYINYSDFNLTNYRQNVFEKNLSFTTINEWYEKYFGSALPLELEDKTVSVNQNKVEIQEVSPYHDGFRSSITKNGTISALNSGIVVFIGEKEHYGNVLIVQGVDGVDIWYGNIENINVSLYDYVEKETILGSAKDNDIYLVFQKDGKYLDYDEYKSQI